MDFNEYERRFDEASHSVREFCIQLLPQTLPEKFRFDFGIPYDSEMPDGRIKFLGGRLLPAFRLFGIEQWTAAKYLWPNDGRIPAWVNLSPDSQDGEFLYLRVRFSDFLTRDHSRLPPDLHHSDEFDIRPFRVRGRDPAEGPIPRRSSRNQPAERE